MKKYLVTISIPTYNSARTLELCLAAVNAQTYRNIEINIVDKYSKDETIKIARNLGLPRFKSAKDFLLKINRRKI